MTGKSYKCGKFVYYYDRPSRSWWAFETDAEGNQVGDAFFDFRREWIVKEILRRDGHKV